MIEVENSTNEESTKEESEEEESIEDYAEDNPAKEEPLKEVAIESVECIFSNFERRLHPLLSLLGNWRGVGLT